VCVLHNIEIIHGRYRCINHNQRTHSREREMSYWVLSLLSLGASLLFDFCGSDRCCWLPTSVLVKKTLKSVLPLSVNCVLTEKRSSNKKNPASEEGASTAIVCSAKVKSAIKRASHKR
jgi:hypothetical protein